MQGFNLSPTDNKQDLLKFAASSSGLANALGGYGYAPAGSSAPSAATTSSGGSGSGLGTTGSDYLSLAGGAQNLAKDMAQFQLGINRQQSAQDAFFRNKEDLREFGQTKQLKQQDYRNTYGLQGQQIAGTQTLEETRQGAETGRLQSQLANQKEMQSADFNNQTQQRAQSAALAQLGFRR